MTDEQYKQLAKLVTYLLESEDWKTVWLSEYSEPIRLFMFKTGLTFRRIKKYIEEALNKLLGPVYYQIQSRLKRKISEPNDLLYKPKPKYVPATTGKKHHHNAGKTLVPWSEFGRKYLEHYRLSEVLKTKLNMRENESSLKKKDMLPGKLRNRKKDDSSYLSSFLI